MIRQRYDRDRRYVYVNDRDRYYVYNAGYKGYHTPSHGPAFCRNGAGHPVFGYAWCADHGYDPARRNTRYVYVDDRDEYYYYGTRPYVYGRPRYQRPRPVVHYVVIDDRDRYYDPYYNNGYYSDPYYNDPYYNDPYYNDPYYSGGYYNDGYYNDGYYNDGYYNDPYYRNDPYYSSGPYGYDPYYRRDSGSLLENILAAVLFPQSTQRYYVEQPTYYVLRPRYYVAPTGYYPTGLTASTGWGADPLAFNATPVGYTQPSYALVSLNFTI